MYIYRPWSEDWAEMPKSAPMCNGCYTLAHFLVTPRPNETPGRVKLEKKSCVKIFGPNSTLRLNYFSVFFKIYVLGHFFYQSGQGSKIMTWNRPVAPVGQVVW
jgi:hypothetical protein